jgi:hypothetical protein
MKAAKRKRLERAGWRLASMGDPSKAEDSWSLVENG